MYILRLPVCMYGIAVVLFSCSSFKIIGSQALKTRDALSCHNVLWMHSRALFVACLYIQYTHTIIVLMTGYKRFATTTKCILVSLVHTTFIVLCFLFWWSLICLLYVTIKLLSLSLSMYFIQSDQNEEFDKHQVLLAYRQINYHSWCSKSQKTPDNCTSRFSYYELTFSFF